MKPFTELQLPVDGEYSSDDRPLPIEFFLTTFPSTRNAYLKLGYFSSTAIQVLAFGFAQFVANGGHLHIVTNHFLYDHDKVLLDPSAPPGVREGRDPLLSDPGWVAGELSQSSRHVLDCLRLLINCNRLSIVPVMLKPSRMVHYKEGVFIDHKGQILSFTGSCNFTGSGLLENGESISVSCAWKSDMDLAKCNKRLDNISSIVTRQNDRYRYLSKEEVVDAALELGREKSVEDLLRQELTLVDSPGGGDLRDILKMHKKTLAQAIDRYDLDPRFPYESGPRDYQSEAYEKWVANDRCGIFAMATGTGKTITALNCVLEEFRLSEKYQVVVLVPTKVLVDQWAEEASNFNIRNTYQLYSSNPGWLTQLEMLSTSLAFDADTSFFLVTTYETFVGDKCFKHMSKLPAETMLIADEAHNFARPGMRDKIKEFPFSSRIALSATPKRRFDEEGNQAIESYFCDKEPYCYSFSMARAIDEGILCGYRYHPRIIRLTPDESLLYAEISAKLAKLYDADAGTFFNPEVAKILLLERRRVIHKASNKLPAFGDIIGDLRAKDILSFCFVYTPEGESDEGENLLQNYMHEFQLRSGGMRAHHYTSKTESRSEVMSRFESGVFEALFSMKCLDEGVDIPRAEVAIFCSSTGNPRQFIQRRGRVLRRHPDKAYATIYDLIVAPDRSSVESMSFELERKLLREELVRLINFAAMATNYYDAMNEVKLLAESYELNIFALQQELEGT